MNPLQNLNKLGESIWMDNIRRGMLSSGQLKQYIDRFYLTGLTSNPTIFEHAIGGSNDYDEGILKRLDTGQSAEEIFFDLALEDLQEAADLFRPYYDKSGGRDGFVSLELSPELADDANASIEQAKRLHARASRPNMLFKVPGTKAGAAAIEELIYEGIPVNVTLLFAPDHYVAAAEAYLRGIERRMQEGLDPLVPSVASLFISRWDKNSVDGLPDNLKNKLGVAIGMQTYRKYREIYDSERWKDLEKRGARPQRLLWASTGTKDPSLPDDYYVHALTAPETINTMPEATLLAFSKTGRVGSPLPKDGGESAKILESINKAGTDVEELGEWLQENGKDKFSKSYHHLLAVIEKKRSELREAHEQERESLGPLAKAVEATLESFDGDRINERIWDHDHTVWSNDPTEITNRLGWLNLPHDMLEEVDRLNAFTESVRQDGLTHVLWSGMGGSSLFPQVLQQAFPDQKDGLKLEVLDSSNPVTIKHVADHLPIDKTLFVFASKSGGTLETRCHLDYFWEKCGNPRQFAIVTDRGSPLDQIGQERNFRQIFHNDPDLGGRYSALSHFGLVAGALLGVDLEELLHRAGQMMAACMSCVSTAEHPGFRLGAALALAARDGRDKCTLVMPEEINRFAMWLEQLIAESTGKHGVGILPVANEQLGTQDDYGDDRIFVVLGGLSGAGRIPPHHPVITLPYVDPYSIGAEVFRWEFAIAVAGKILGIHPFNQPNVEAAKKAASRVLKEGIPEFELTPVKEMLANLKPGNYLAIQAYIDADSEKIETIERARTNLRNRYRVATTVGVGPRYLHSTGQLHKGGRKNGVFLQIVDDLSPDQTIPGRDYTFAKLFQAQAAGDHLALEENGLRVAQVKLEDLLAEAGVKA